jgi:hypothetical protein
MMAVSAPPGIGVNAKRALPLAGNASFQQAATGVGHLRVMRQRQADEVALVATSVTLALLLIALDDLGLSNVSRIRVTTGLTQRASLPQQVPGLVERHLELLQALPVGVGRAPCRLSFPKFVLLGNELLDGSVDL